MGYVLPTIPDTLLETMKHIPSNTKAIKQVQRIEQVKSIKYDQTYSEAKRKLSYHPYKGRHIDLYG